MRAVPASEPAGSATRPRDRPAAARRRCRRSATRRRGSRGADHRGRVDRAEHDRVTGTDRDAVDREAAELRDELRGVVVAAGAGSGDDDQQVASLDRPADCGGDARPGRPARSPARRPRSRPARAWAASISEFVSISSPGASSEPTGRISSPVGRIATTGGRRTTISIAPAAAAAATSTARSRCAGGQEEFGGADVLADRAHVLVGRDRRAQLGLPVDVVDVLAHHDRVGIAWERVAGVHDRERSAGNSSGVVSLAPTGVGGADRYPVHRGGVKRRRRPRGPDRLRGHPADGLLEREGDGGRREPGSRPAAGTRSHSSSALASKARRAGTGWRCSAIEEHLDGLAGRQAVGVLGDDHVSVGGGQDGQQRGRPEDRFGTLTVASLTWTTSMRPAADRQVARQPPPDGADRAARPSSRPPGARSACR